MMYYFTIFIKKTLRYVLKPLSFAPALIMMYLIFSFSAQTGQESGSLSYSVSKYVVLGYNKILGKGLDNEALNALIISIHPWVRKSAHVWVYFCLAISVSFPLYVYRIRGFYLFWICSVFCLIFAFFDEYHQSFVSGRSPSLRDVGIDSIGILAGTLTAEILCFIGRKTLFSPLSLEDYRKKKENYDNSQEELPFDSK